MKKQSFLNFRSAYGQLVLIVFLPIVSLAMVGGYLVFSEVRRSTLSEQEALAQAALIRYEPVVRQVLSHMMNDEGYTDDQALSLLNQLKLEELFESSVKTDIPSVFAFFNSYTARQEWLKRMLITNDKGEMLINTGLAVQKWQGFDPRATQAQIVSLKTSTAYGMPVIVEGRRFWLLADMDDKPLVITYYRVALALVATGLITLLLLLLILSSYSKRWIAPIYEMRLYLQRLNTETLCVPMDIDTKGEFLLLQKDFVQAIQRLDASFSDLTAHAKETEDDLQQAFDEMEMQNISIRQARDLAVSTSQAKTAFLANISHELRTPLNSIDGFINLLARHNGLTGEQNLYVQTIKKSSAHLLALVNDVLDFSKMEAGKLVLDMHEFDLYSVIYDVVDMLSPTALEKHLRLSVLFYNDVPSHIQGDSLRVKQILTNLVGNAIKFTDSGGVVVKVSLAEHKEGFLHIAVEDTGKGVSETDKEQLFKSFSQGDLSITRRYGGTGLGLVISKQLTMLMGGEIGFFDNNCENIAPTGATFWFEMPICLGGSDSSGADEAAMLVMDISPKLLVWINYAPAMQVLKASLAQTKAQIHFAIGLADLLEQLDKPNHGFDWVIVDYFGQDAAQDDVGAILRQIRQRYQGKLSAYGYQVGMDTAMLTACKTYALYEPMDKRQLYAMLLNQNVSYDDTAWQMRFEGKTVLAVDDHAPNLLVLKALLGELGVEVVTANSGFDAIEIMTKTLMGTSSKIDLIFMDIQMPRMSGLEATIEIRKIESAHQASPVPIIALTAHGLADEKERLVASGLNDYVGKPIGLSQLVQTLQKWLDPTQHALSTPNLKETSQYQTSNHQHDSTSVVVSKTESQMMADIDWQEALERSAYKEDLAKTLLTLLLESVDSEKIALERAWADRDRVGLADITHRMVGASRYTGTPRLRQAAEEFESRCRLEIDNVSASQFISMRPSYRALIDALDGLGNIDMEKIQ